mgnify:CR=1 FL=1|jgi:hypothetical protein
MPVQSWGHSQYWVDLSTVVVPKPPTSGVAGYPMWQSGVIMGSGFGAVGALASLWGDRLRVLLRVVRRMWLLSPLQRAVVWRVIETVDRPEFAIAVGAVRNTALRLGFNRPEAWGDLKAELKRDPGNAENTFRHLQTVNTLRLNCVSSTFTNPQAHLLVELAYHAYAMKGQSSGV